MEPKIIQCKNLFCIACALFVSGIINCSSSRNVITLPLTSASNSWTAKNPGLLNDDGSVHPVPAAHAVTGTKIDVTQSPYNADKSGAADSRAAIESAMNAAAAGDEIYFPNGTYLLDSANSADPKSNIRLRSGVNLRGESRTGTILKTTFDDIYNAATPAGSNTMFVIRGSAVSSIYISNLTITSTFNRSYSTDTGTNSTTHGGPDICINLGGSSTAFSSNIVIENVTVEKFINIGILAGRGCHDILIKKCMAQNATDVAGGGNGYGFQLSGKGDNSRDNSTSYANPNLGTTNDNYFNTIDGCTNSSQYIRHAALIEYWAHNNQVINCTFDNTRLDSIDLHGEDEYNNEISGNTITNSKGESAVGSGNSGGTSVVHDKSGPWNYIHDNTIVNCKRGITVQYGTPDALIRNNDISGCAISGGIGINLGYTDGTLADGNNIHDNGAASFTGILLYQDNATGNSRAGSPSNCSVVNNTITGNQNGTAISISSQEYGNVFSGNIATGNAVNSTSMK